MKRNPAVSLRSSETIYRGPVFRVLLEELELPSGRPQKVAVVDHDGAVGVAPVLEDGRLIVVRQYRHAVGDWLIEIPAGRLEPGENPLDAARRELEEETGYRARSWSARTTFFPAPGFCAEAIHLFEARGLEAVPGGGLSPDPDEELEVLRMTPQELLAGATQDAKTLLAAALLLRSQEEATDSPAP